MFLHKSYVGKNLVPKVQTKMLSASHVAGFSNQLFLQNKLTKQLHFLHVDTNSQKLKVDWLGVVKSWCGQSGAWFLELTVSEE